MNFGDKYPWSIPCMPTHDYFLTTTTSSYYKRWIEFSSQDLKGYHFKAIDTQNTLTGLRVFWNPPTRVPSYQAFKKVLLPKKEPYDLIFPLYSFLKSWQTRCLRLFQNRREVGNLNTVKYEFCESHLLIFGSFSIYSAFKTETLIGVSRLCMTPYSEVSNKSGGWYRRGGLRVSKN